MKFMLIALFACIAAAIMAVIVIEEVQRNREAESSMPIPEFISAHDMDKKLREESGWVAIKGSGSMAPYIPASEDPKKIVAYVKVERCDFNDLRKNNLVVFDTQKFGQILHQLSQKTAACWITSGLHNHTYDSTRVYPDNFRGRVVKTLILK